jgi:hypothetical protein
MTMALDIARCLYPILIASRLPDFRGMSAFGPKRTSLAALHMSTFGGRADMPFCGANVCF